MYTHALALARRSGGGATLRRTQSSHSKMNPGGEVVLVTHDQPAADEGDSGDLFLSVSRFFSSPRVISFIKWTVISGVSVGVCAVVIHYYVRYQNNALRDALKSSIDALKNTIETENTMLIRTVETQNRIIEAEHQTISTLFRSLERRVESENETIQQLLETICKLTEQNAKSIEQLSRQQHITASVLQVAQKPRDGTGQASIEKQIGSAVTWCVGKSVGAVKYLFGW